MREIIREDPNSELSNERSSYCERWEDSLIALGLKQTNFAEINTCTGFFSLSSLSSPISAIHISIYVNPILQQSTLKFFFFIHELTKN
jgi:hypothetical protein